MVEQELPKLVTIPDACGFALLNAENNSECRADGAGSCRLNGEHGRAARHERPKRPSDSYGPYQHGRNCNRLGAEGHAMMVVTQQSRELEMRTETAVSQVRRLPAEGTQAAATM